MYKLTSNPNVVLRVADSAFIPNDPANRDYAEYQAWLATGNIPQSADPVPVPQAPKSLVDQILSDPTQLAQLKKTLGLP